MEQSSVCAGGDDLARPPSTGALASPKGPLGYERWKRRFQRTALYLRVLCARAPTLARSARVANGPRSREGGEDMIRGKLFGFSRGRSSAHHVKQINMAVFVRIAGEVYTVRPALIASTLPSLVCADAKAVACDSIPDGPSRSSSPPSKLAGPTSPPHNPTPSHTPHHVRPSVIWPTGPEVHPTARSRCRPLDRRQWRPFCRRVRWRTQSRPGPRRRLGDGAAHRRRHPAQLGAFQRSVLSCERCVGRVARAVADLLISGSSRRRSPRDQVHPLEWSRLQGLR